MQSSNVSENPKTKNLTYRRALNKALQEAMREDPSVFIIGEGIAQAGGIHKVTVGLLKEFGPKRVIDTPIAEASFTGIGVGAALAGMRPVVEIMFIDFAGLIGDQVVNQAAKLKLMTGFHGRVPLVIRTQCGTGSGLAAQHSQCLEAWYYHTPGLKCVMPSTPCDAKGLLKAAIRDNDPVIFIEHKQLYTIDGPVPVDDYIIELGKGDIKREGKDITVIAWSHMIHKSLEASEVLARMGIDVEIVDPRTLVPLDRELIINSVRKTGRAVIVQEAARRGGVASDIASIIQEEVFDSLKAPVKIIAGRNTPIPYNLTLESASIPQVSDIVSGVKSLVDRQ